jgi:glycine cleavage system H protein
MNVPKDCRYTKDHEWARKDGAEVIVGITDYAQTELGDVVFADPPKSGTKVQKGQSLGVVESVKAVSDIYAPISGTVVSGNEELRNSPEKINAEPFGQGWFARIQPESADEFEGLLDPTGYQALLSEIAK